MRLPKVGDVVNYWPQRGNGGAISSKVENVEIVCDLKTDSGRGTAYHRYYSETGEPGTWNWPEEKPFGPPRSPHVWEMVVYVTPKGIEVNAQVIQVLNGCLVHLREPGKYIEFVPYSPSGDPGTWHFPEPEKPAEETQPLSAVDDPEYTDPMEKLRAIADELGAGLDVTWHIGCVEVRLTKCTFANAFADVISAKAGAEGAAAEKVLRVMSGRWIMWARDGKTRAREMPAYRRVEPEKPAEPVSCRVKVQARCGSVTVDGKIVDGEIVVPMETIEKAAADFLQAEIKRDLRDAVTALWRADEASEPAALDAIEKAVTDLRAVKEEAAKCGM